MMRRPHRIGDLAAAVNGQLHGTAPDRPVHHLCIDSRKPLPADGSLFIALRGERHDGHRYIPALIERGVRDFVVARDFVLPTGTALEGLNFIVVADPLDALQRMAAWHRAQHHFPVVGITGSNGKTVVKEWLFHLLRDEHHMVRSPGSWNSQVGVPLSVWQMRPEHTLGLFEAGISRPGEMDRLRAMIHPTIGILTNIGPAHGSGFRDDAHKVEEKLRLFAGAEVLVHCADHTVVADAVRRTGLGQRLTEVTWGRNTPAWLHVTHEQRHGHGTRITVLTDRHGFTFEVPFTDPASVENVLHCVTLLLHLGHKPAWIAARTPHLPPVAMRLETVDGRHGTTLINDAYSNDPTSLAIALDHLDQVAAGRPKAVVLTDLHDSPDPPDQRYRQVGELLARGGVAQVLCVGPELAAATVHMPPTARFFPDTAALLTGVELHDLAGHAILVKGARQFALEKVVARWQRQVHGTLLEVDLEAIRHNLNHFRAKLAPGVRVMAMAKAFGYGAGALELARLMAHERVDCLGVAYADEGVELRQAGIDLPIMVMNPEPVELGTLQRFDLEPEVYDARTLAEVVEFARLHPGALTVHIKLDTGMHRLGFGADDLPALLSALRQAPRLRVATIFSHLVASEDPAMDAFTHRQIALFTQMADAIDAVLDHRPLRHIANTAAVSRFPEAHFDMVRLGIGLHGLGHDAAETALLRPAASLRTPIAQLRQVPAGDGVGYGARDAAPTPRTIATLPIGYADGLSRRLGNGVGAAWVQGRRAPIVGHVCMDMVMVDVTGIPCAVGDPAWIIGPEQPVQVLAQQLGTIPYEVLTSIAPRVKRVYVRGWT